MGYLIIVDTMKISKIDRLQYIAEELLRANKPNKHFFLMYICKWSSLSFSLSLSLSLVKDRSRVCSGVVKVCGLP